MTLADYLRVIVLPTLAEMLAEPADQRRAYLACITAAHLVDYVAVTLPRRPDGKPDIRTVRSRVNQLGPGSALALEIVEAVCNGTKHAGPDPKPNRQVKFSPGRERAVSTMAYDTGSVGYGDGRYDLPGGIVVDHGEQPWFLDDCIRGVIQAHVIAFPALFAGVDLAPLVSVPDIAP